MWPQTESYGKWLKKIIIICMRVSQFAHYLHFWLIMVFLLMEFVVVVVCVCMGGLGGVSQPGRRVGSIDQRWSQREREHFFGVSQSVRGKAGHSSSWPDSSIKECVWLEAWVGLCTELQHGGKSTRLAHRTHLSPFCTACLFSLLATFQNNKMKLN